MDQAISLLVIGPNSKNSTGSATIRHFSKSARLTASFKKAGVCFVAAIVSVFVPVLHFILVPTLLIGAIFSFVFNYKRQAQIVEASTLCPLCNNELKIGKVEPNWPLAITCPSCSAQVYVQDGSLEPLISISIS